MRPKSEEAYQKMCDWIPGGVNSPMRACVGMGQSPMIVDSGKGDLITDLDGKQYIDYCGSWGALIHGHAHPVILKHVQARMEKGTSFGISNVIEGTLAAKIIEVVDSVEKIRFVNSGTEATMSAVRLARGFTKRIPVLKFNGNYHGHADFFLVKAGSGLTDLPSSSSAGIPEESVKGMISLPYNAFETVQNFLRTHEVAAVILEPIAGNMGVVPANSEFVQMLREETKRQGALLIFDEVMTGFRVAWKGADSLYHVKPDLSCFGKVIGAGFPVAAFGGRADVMDHLAPLGSVYQAGTLSGNPVAMEAGLQALKLLEANPNSYQELKRKTDLITEPVRKFLEKHQISACIQQEGSMFTLFFGATSVENQEKAKTLDVLKFASFFRYMFKNGVYIPPSQFEAWFVSVVHEEKHLEKTRDLILDFLSEEI